MWNKTRSCQLQTHKLFSLWNIPPAKIRVEGRCTGKHVGLERHKFEKQKNIAILIKYMDVREGLKLKVNSLYNNNITHKVCHTRDIPMANV